MTTPASHRRTRQAGYYPAYPSSVTARNIRQRCLMGGILHCLAVTKLLGQHDVTMGCGALRYAGLFASAMVPSAWTGSRRC